MVAGPGSAPMIAACAHRLSACSAQASSSVARSRPASPGTTRRAGVTIQLVVASTKSPTGLRNGTRSHWKWKRASNMKTKKPATVSTRKTAIWANMSVLSELFAHLDRAQAPRLDRPPQPFCKLLLVEHFQRGFRSAAARSDVLAQGSRRLGAGGGELRCAEHGVQGELHCSL